MSNYPYYPASAKNEVTFPGTIKRGQRGSKARRVQEWVSFHGFKTTIDSDFGPATEACVRDFQVANGINNSGTINEATWNALVKPMISVLENIDHGQETTSAQHVLGFARKHLEAHPVEIGGQNAGPWVRMYMSGNQGVYWPWCAGFITFVMKQAYGSMDKPLPIRGSFSCDSLAYQAKQADLFIPGNQLANGNQPWVGLGDSWVFLNRRTSTDWTHTGFGFSGIDNIFRTIEGNTNDDGSREGYEVCQRIRSLNSRDFILLP